MTENDDMSNTIPVTVDGTLIFAQLHKVNKFEKYSADLVPLNSDEEAKLTNLGMSERKQSEGLQAAMKALGLEGRKVFAIERRDQFIDKKTNSVVKLGPATIIDREGNAVTTSLGNGTTARVNIGVYTTTYQGKTFKKATVNSVVVVKHVEYTKAEVPTVDDSELAKFGVTEDTVPFEGGTTEKGPSKSDIEGILG